MLSLNYTKGLIPVVVQEEKTKEVLMVAYANADAVNLTRVTGFAHFFSRSRRNAVLASAPHTAPPTSAISTTTAPNKTP